MVVIGQLHNLSAILALIESLREVISTLSVVLAVLALDLVVNEPSALGAAIDRRDDPAVAILHAVGILALLDDEDLLALAVG